MNKQRVVTGALITIVYVAVCLLSMYVHPIFFDIFILLLAAGGVYEVCKAVAHFASEPIWAIDFVTVGAGFAGFWFSQYYFKTLTSGMVGYFVMLAVMIIITLIVTAASKKFVKGNAVSTIFVMLYPTALLMFAVGMNYFINGEMGAISVETALPARNVGILLLFIVPAFTDVFAYQIGSAIKGKKLCPNISPNKTVSGAIGGLVGGLIGGGIVALLTFFAERFGSIYFFNLKMLTGSWVTTVVNLLLLGLFGSVFDQIGDLAASLIKRRAGIKDYSNLLPGHGGILDRVDGFLFSAVFFYMYLEVMLLL